MGLQVSTNTLLMVSLEDTFLLLDALEAEMEELRRRGPVAALEVCSGSAAALAFLAQHLAGSIVCLATDLNPAANRASQGTAQANLVSLDALRTNLADGIVPRNLFDVIICNPPYVPTDPNELPRGRQCGKEGERTTTEWLQLAWAGGERGRFWIDLLLPRIDGLLSPNGVFYLLVHQDNGPQELRGIAKDRWNLQSAIVKETRAGTEHLSIIKFFR